MCKLQELLGDGFKHFVSLFCLVDIGDGFKHFVSLFCLVS